MLAPFALILKTKSGSLIPREDPATKSDEFLKKCQRGGEWLIFNQKNYIADFGNFKHHEIFHTIKPSYLLAYMQPQL